MSKNHPKLAQPDHPVLDLIKERFSPYVYEPRPVEKDKLLSCLEAARWQASSYNEQPWRFIVAQREHTAEFEKALSCLVEANQEWAKNAGVLILTLTATHFSRNGKPNAVCEHDIGLAAANLTVQATALGLHVHQMAGIESQQIKIKYKVPEGYKPLTAIAIGYAGNPAEGDEELAERDLAGRERKPLSEWVYGDEFNKKATLL